MPNIAFVNMLSLEIAGGVPEGMILFYNGITTPTNWQEFNDANDKVIIGAGDSYTSGATGGTDTPTSYTENSGSGGSHTSGQSNQVLPTSIPGIPLNPTVYYRYEETAGLHSHPYGYVEFIPEKNKLKLIKASIDTENIPKDVVVLSETSLSGLSNVLTDSKFLGASSSIGTINETARCLMGGGGDHRHITTSESRESGGYPTGYAQYNITTGEHYDFISLTITENIKRALLSAWTHASQEFTSRPGMIGLWESPILPEGWELCTYMQDAFFKSVTTGSENTTASGDNTIDITSTSTTANHDAYHSHYFANDDGYDVPTESGVGEHSGYTWNHSHTVSLAEKNDVAHLLPYYALYFIKKS